MSRIGKKPIAIPNGIQVKVEAERVLVEGPKGKLEQALVSGVSVAVEGDLVVVGRQDDQRGSRANQGLMRSLINSMVNGAHKGYEKVLEVSGVGYRAELQGDKLTLNLGYSHSIEYIVSKKVKVSVDKQTRIVVQGADAQAVGQTAAEIRAFKIPDPYKAKGITYAGEQIRRKAGKKAVG